MKAIPLIRCRSPRRMLLQRSPWRVPELVPPFRHPFKYRLAYGSVASVFCATTTSAARAITGITATRSGIRLSDPDQPTRDFGVTLRGGNHEHGRSEVRSSDGHAEGRRAGK